MKYSGGKSRSAKRIAQVIRDLSIDRGMLVAPFVGGASVELELVHDFDRLILTDVSTDLILMWRALQQGRQAPGDLTENQYRELKTAQPSALRGFAGFGASFGGKWFGGYGRISEAQAHRNGGARTCAEQVARGLVKDAERIRSGDVQFFNVDYRELQPTAGHTVYADPPYAGTLGYAAAGAFDSDEFWQTMREWVTNGAQVFVSEESAPSDWKEVWSANVAGSMDRKDRVRTEKLFTK